LYFFTKTRIITIVKMTSTDKPISKLAKSKLDEEDATSSRLGNVLSYASMGLSLVAVFVSIFVLITGYPEWLFEIRQPFRMGPNNTAIFDTENSGYERLCIGSPDCDHGNIDLHAIFNVFGGGVRLWNYEIVPSDDLKTLTWHYINPSDGAKTVMMIMKEKTLVLGDTVPRGVMTNQHQVLVTGYQDALDETLRGSKHAADIWKPLTHATLIDPVSGKVGRMQLVSHKEDESITGVRINSMVSTLDYQSVLIGNIPATTIRENSATSSVLVYGGNVVIQKSVEETPAIRCSTVPEYGKTKADLRIVTRSDNSSSCWHYALEDAKQYSMYIDECYNSDIFWGQVDPVIPFLGSFSVRDPETTPACLAVGADNIRFACFEHWPMLHCNAAGARRGGTISRSTYALGQCSSLTDKMSVLSIQSA
jgi:hypothetical protein